MKLKDCGMSNYDSTAATEKSALLVVVGMVIWCIVVRVEFKTGIEEPISGVLYVAKLLCALALVG